MRRALLACVCAAATALAAGRAFASDRPAIWQQIGFDQRIGAALPLDARFTDDDGRVVALGDVLRGRPAVLVMTYFDCPNLCSVVLTGAFEALAHDGLAAGRDYELVAVDIDPRETPAVAARTKAGYLQRFGREVPAAGVHFLTGRQAGIDAVTRAVGFRYVYDDALKQYAHAAGLVVVAPDGRVSRYLFGARFATLPLRLALVDAAQGRIGSLADRVWLLCYHYDPANGRYGFAIVTALKVAGSLAALALAAFIATTLRNERRRSARAERVA